MKKLLNKVDMRQHHAPTTVSLELEAIEGIPLIHILRQQFEVVIPFVSNHLATRKTAHWDNLCGVVSRCFYVLEGSHCKYHNGFKREREMF